MWLRLRGLPRRIYTAKPRGICTSWSSHGLSHEYSLRTPPQYVSYNSSAAFATCSRLASFKKVSRTKELSTISSQTVAEETHDEVQWQQNNTHTVEATAVLSPSTILSYELLKHSDRQPETVNGGHIADESFPTSAEYTIPKLVGDEMTAQKSSLPYKVSKNITLSLVHESCFPLIVDSLRKARELGLPTSKQEPQAVPISNAINRPDKSRIERMQSASNHLSSPKVKPHRLNLPIMRPENQKKVIDELRKNDVLIVSAATGSGKTTQVPQIILDHAIMQGRGGFTNIVCTQPRRISTTSVAKRVSRERNEVLGKSVGYQVRFTQTLPRAFGGITYSTTGYLLRRIRYEEDVVLDSMSHIIVDEVHERSIEVDLLLTTLRELAWSRNKSGKPMPKIILMSATIDAQRFSEYFEEPSSGSDGLRVSTMHVEGRMYPVDTHYLDDMLPALMSENDENTIIGRSLRKKSHATILEYLERERKALSPTTSCTESETSDDAVEDDGIVEERSESDPTMDVQEVLPSSLVAAAILHVFRTSKDGDILVFVPGLGAMDSVSYVLNTLKRQREVPTDFDDEGKCRVFKLHSMFGEANDTVFEPVPNGCRRIILATNIAETSLTLPDVIHIIDTGLFRQKHFDQLTGYTYFGTRWVSKASSLQRRGRAGRVRPGQYHALFFRARHEQFPEKAIPDIYTSDITRYLLDVKVHSPATNVKEFFSRAPSPPKPAVVDITLSSLRNMGAITKDGEPTRLGRILTIFPLEPALTKMLLLGMLFKCFRPILLAASHSPDNPIINGRGFRTLEWKAKKKFAETDSDLFAWINAFEKYHQASQAGDLATITDLETNDFVRRGSYESMILTASQVCSLLADMGLLPDTCHRQDSFLENIPPELNENSGNIPLVKALTFVATNTNLSDYIFDNDNLVKGWKLSDWSPALIDPRGVCGYPQSPYYKAKRLARQPGELWTYRTLHQTIGERLPFLLETTLLSPLMATLFAASVQQEGRNVLKLNEWLRLNIQVDYREGGPVINKPAKAVREYRKAIDRFLTLAYSTLDDERRRSGRKPVPNSSMFGEDSPLRTHFVTGLAKILETDQAAWKKLRDAALIDAEQRVAAIKAAKQAEQEAKKKALAEAEEREEFQRQSADSMTHDSDDQAGEDSAVKTAESEQSATGPSTSTESDHVTHQKEKLPQLLPQRDQRPKIVDDFAL